LAELREVDHAAEGSADQALDLVRPPAETALDRLAIRPLGGRAREHRVLGRHPASALPPEVRGTRSPIVAAHSTSVSPARMRHDPSAHFWTPRVMLTARRSPGRRPSARTLGGRLPIAMVPPFGATNRTSL